MVGDIIQIINYACLIGLSLFFLILCVVSIVEKEYRASLIAFFSMIFNGAFFWLLINYQMISWVKTGNLLLLIGLVFFGLISLIKFFPKSMDEKDLSNVEQYDERDNMFARNNIQNHPDLMEKYYQDKPEQWKIDQEIHKKMEFGEKGQKFHDHYATPCYEAAFEYMERTIPASLGEPAAEKKEIDTEKFARSIIKIAKFYGACDVGFTPLKKHHFYSHSGRHAKNWGKEIKNSHQTAVVITVQMNVEMLKKAPSNTVIQESARKYLEAAKISNLVAGYIRNFGYAARAHNDANYDVLCVPLAVDAGLGELGRMGVLVHRVYGSCVRLAVVTTDLKLPQSEKKKLYIEEFCKICKKCSDNCPTNSICSEDENSSRGFVHWSIDQEKCFSFWKEIGSDCGFCLAVCPYAKPDTFIHKLVRFYISRNPINQRVALFFDDLLYGRKIKIQSKNPKDIFSYK